MRLGRVLIAIALVAILSGSFIVGLLSTLPSDRAVSVAYADSHQLTKLQAEAWFPSGQLDRRGNSVHIVSSPDNKPPYFDVQTDGGPKIRFKLFHLLGVGRGLGLEPATPNQDYYIFNAYELSGIGDARTESLIPNLYIISYDATNRGVVVIPRDGKAFNDIVDDLENNIGRFLPDPGNLDPDVIENINIGDNAWGINYFGFIEKGWQDLTRYIYINPNPENRDANCRDNDISTTKVVPGPTNSPDGGPLVLSENGDTWANLNANCLNRDPSGWPRHWGVNVTGSAFEAVDAFSGCSVNAWNVATTPIGDVMIKIVACAFQRIVQGASSIVDNNNTSSPLNSIACISYRIPDVAVSRAHAQSDDRVECNRTGEGAVNSLGSLETELKRTSGADESPIHKVWKVSMGVVNVVVILALLAIAFANILHLNINTYAAKKALPGLVIGVIGANASWLMAQFMVDITGAVSTWAADLGTHGGTITKLITLDFPVAIGRALLPLTETVLAAVIAGTFLAGPVPIYIALIIVLFAFLYYLFLIIAFMFALFKRIVIIYFLIMIAPIAFIAYGIPSFQKYFTQWWDHLIRQLFVFPIILFSFIIKK